MRAHFESLGSPELIIEAIPAKADVIAASLLTKLGKYAPAALTKAKISKLVVSDLLLDVTA